MTPQRAVYRAVFAEVAKTFSTFDYLIKDEVPYPFAWLADTYGNNTPMNDLIGEVSQTIHVWTSRTKIAGFDDKIGDIHNNLLNLTEAYNYNIRYQDINIRYISENEGREPLVHVVIEVSYLFTKKEN